MNNNDTRKYVAGEPVTAEVAELAAEIAVPVFTAEGVKSPVQVAKLALKKAEAEGYDVLIVDTAGRLHLDEELMGELAEMKRVVA